MPGEDGLYTLFLALRSHLARAVMRIVPPKEVEDIVQETYVRICQIEKNGRSLEEPRAFLFKTARNLALDHLKRSETRLTISIDEAQDYDLTEQREYADHTFEQVASAKEFALFCEAVRELPVQCRRVFVLKKVYGYSQREIARELSISENTVEKHVAMGVKRCTLFMRQYDEERPAQKKHDKGNRVRGANGDEGVRR